MMNEKFLFWGLVALNSLDVLFTTLILIAGGSEANPYVRLFIGQFGYVGLAIAKIPPLTILGFIIHTRWHQIIPRFQTIIRWVLLAINIVFGGVIVYSVAILLDLL